MASIDYKAVLNDTLRELAAANREIERLGVEAAKLRQFFCATLNMLPDGEKTEFMRIFSEANEAVSLREASLKDAILRILRDGYPGYLTVTDVRDRLRKNGFDFSGYTSNELASVSTTLRRFKPQDVETTDIEGVAAFRAKQSHLAIALTEEARKRKHYGLPGVPSGIPGKVEK